MVGKFTVIEGGGQGPPDRHGAMARHHLHMLILETLRALTRGTDPEERISTHLEQLVEHLIAADIPITSVVKDVIVDLNKRLDHRDERDIFEERTEPIVLAALQVAAEALANDPAAKGRLSGRQQRLRAAIESQIHEHKQRASKQTAGDRYDRAMEMLRHVKPTPGSPKGSDRAPAPRRGVKKDRPEGDDEKPDRET